MNKKHHLRNIAFVSILSVLFLNFSTVASASPHNKLSMQERLEESRKVAKEIQTDINTGKKQPDLSDGMHDGIKKGLEAAKEYLDKNPQLTENH